MSHRSVTVATLSVVLAASVSLGATAARAQDDAPGPSGKKVHYSPYPEQTFPNRVYFGDTHLHTSYSADAGMIGNTLGPDEAYRFAKGEVVTSSTGLKARLARPLDFLVVADHAENLGIAPLLAARDPEAWVVTIGHYRHYHTLFEAMIVDGIAEGSVTPTIDADAAAQAIVSLGMGLILQGLLDPEGADWGRVAEDSIHILLDGLRNHI